MREIVTVTLIFGYFIFSILIGVNQYRTIGELSTVYLTVQWVVFAISVFCTMKFEKTPTKIGDTLATLGGGIAMMIIFQAVLFYLLGGFIVKNLSASKIISILILAIAIISFIFKILTSSSKK